MSDLLSKMPLCQDLKCPKCQTNFRVADGKRSSQGRSPVLLSCGHSVCETCIRNSVKYTCSLCNQISPLQKNQPLPKHLYIVGLMSNALSQASNNEPFRMKFLPAGMLPVQSRSAKTVKDPCEECSKVRATVRCSKCVSDLCQLCFTKIHAHRTTMSHKAEIIKSIVPAPLPPCAQHEDAVCTHVCSTCSQDEGQDVMFCSSCLLFGGHQRHKVKEVSSLMVECLPDITNAAKDISKVIDSLQDSKKRCAELRALSRESRTSVEQGMRAYVHRLHGFLQLTEETALRTLVTLANDLDDKLASHTKVFEQEIAERENILRAAQNVVKGNGPPVHPVDFLSKLRTLATRYTRLTDVSDDEIFSYKVNDDLKELIPVCVIVTGTAEKILFQPSVQMDLHVQQEKYETNKENRVFKPNIAFDTWLANKEGKNVTKETQNFESSHSKTISCPYHTSIELKCKVCKLGIGQVALSSDFLKTDYKASDDFLKTDHKASGDFLKTDYKVAGDAAVKSSIPDRKASLFGADFNNDDMHPSRKFDTDKPAGVMKNDALTMKLSKTLEEEENDILIGSKSLNLENKSLAMETRIKDSDSVAKSHLYPAQNTLLNLETNMMTDSDPLKYVRGHASNSMTPEEHESIQSTESDTSDVESVNSSEGSSEYKESDESKISSQSALSNLPMDSSETESMVKYINEPVKSMHGSGKMLSDSMEHFSEYRLRSAWSEYGARPKTHRLSLFNNPLEASCSGLMASKNLDISSTSLQSSVSTKTSSLIPAKKPALLAEEKVEVTHVQSPSQFFVQRVIDRRKIGKLQKNINRIAKKKQASRDIVPVVGKTYLARFSRDDVWYRALVESVKAETNQVYVHYIDYGNNEQLSISRLVECPDEYQLENIPSFSLACSLWEMKPARGEIWDSEAIVTFAELVKDAVLHFFVVEYISVNDTVKCQVDLTRPLETPGIANNLPLAIRETLMFLEYAVYCNMSSEDMYNKDAGITLQRSFFQPKIPFGEFETPVLLSSVVTPHKFCLQLVSSAAALRDLMAQLQRHYNSPAVCDSLDWNIYTPKIGMTCVAKYSGDGRWYRAVIEDLPGKRQVDVHYIDYGNKERLWYSKICKITVDFMKLPAQAINCCLQDVTPIDEDWPPTAADQLSSICENQDLKALFVAISNGCCKVDLFICSGEETSDVAELLIDLEIAQIPESLTVGRGSNNPHYRRKLLFANDSSAKRPHHFGKKSIPAVKTPVVVEKGGSLKQVPVLYLNVISPACIYVRLASQSKHYEEFESKLVEAMEKCPPSAEFTPKKGDICVLKLASSPEYARAKVLEVSEASARVVLIDLGRIEEVEMTNLLPLAKPLTKEKSAALAVSLAGIKPPGAHGNQWPGITFDAIKEELSALDNIYIIRKGSSYTDQELGIKILPVELGWKFTLMGGPFEANSTQTVLLNEVLVSDGLALPVRCKESVLANEVDVSAENVTDSSQTLTGDRVSSSDDPTPLPQEFREWLPCPMPTSTNFSATASYIDGKGVIYLQPVSNAKKLEMICDSQTLKFANSKPADEDLCWNPGDPVIAKFHLDKKWYRATVLRTLESGEIMVKFVDYGNEETALVHEIRRSIIYPHLPIQCHECVLYGIEPASQDGHWKTDWLDFIHKNIVEKECRVTVMEEPKPYEPLKVNLFIVEVEMDLGTLLTDHMKFCRRVTPVREVDKLDQSIDVVVESDSSVDEAVELPKLALPASPSIVFPVKVTAIIDPAHVYISPVRMEPQRPSLGFQNMYSQEIISYQNFITSVNDIIDTIPSVKNPQIGELYLGKFTGYWYRVQVKEIGIASATVTYVDAGYSEEIQINCLRECPRNGKEIPAHAMAVELYRVQPLEGPGVPWCEKAMNSMIECLMNSNKIFLAAVMDQNIPSVELYTSDTPDCHSLAYAEVAVKGFIRIDNKSDD